MMQSTENGNEETQIPDMYQSVHRYGYRRVNTILRYECRTVYHRTTLVHYITSGIITLEYLLYKFYNLI